MSAESSTNALIEDASSASAVGESTSIGTPPFESSSSAALAKESRKRQPSLLASDGDGMNASLLQAQPQTQTQTQIVYGTVSGTGQQIPLESDAFPSESTFLASEGTHSVGPGDVDLGNPNTEGKSDTLGIQKQIAEAERKNTMPADGISPLSTSGPGPESESIPPREASPDPSASLASLRPLRKLSSLKWPYVPDLPSYPDPLTRDDPKPLSLPQYEAIARSPAVRRVLASQTHLPTLLRKLDESRGDARERAIERVLGVAPDQESFRLAGLPTSFDLSFSNAADSVVQARKEGLSEVDEEDMKALRELAEAVEGAVRSVGNPGMGFGADPVGLDWEGMEG